MATGKAHCSAKTPGLRIAAIAAAVLAMFAAFASATRLPDSTATSSAGAINTTVGHWAVSGDGSLNTIPLGMVIYVR
ncbi:MAG: hypothetical protein IKE55_07825 [Kiritimatiellae bacterium]|nr:hypothetical protein [Kiritimatiellia bacterium]